MRKRFEKRGSRHGLSAAQWRLLVRVVKEEGISQARIAELLEIEPISVSRLIDRMEEGGWIERRQDPTDRRVRTIFPTAKEPRGLWRNQEPRRRGLRGGAGRRARGDAGGAHHQRSTRWSGISPTAKTSAGQSSSEGSSSMNAISKIDTKNADVTQIEPAGRAPAPTRRRPAVAAPARKRKSGRYLLMAALPILARGRRRLCLGHRRALPGDGECEPAPGAHQHRVRHGGPYRQGLSSTTMPS